MNVVHINTHDSGGGAAVAAKRLHDGLRRYSVDSRMLVSRMEGSSESVATIPGCCWRDYLLGAVTRRMGLNYINNLQTRHLVSHPWIQQGDVLQLHNLHGGYFGYPWLGRLARLCPTVWMLHDMWALTGHCASSFDCDRWRAGCGQCPYPSTYPRIERDATAAEWRWKRWVYNRAPLTILCPSRWLADLATQSILGRFPVKHIPHGLDTEQYQPLNSALARRALNLPTDRHILLTAAADLDDPNKGGAILNTALATPPLSQYRESILLVTMGRGGKLLAEQSGVENVSLDFVFSDRLKALAYSAADLFVLPTKADVFGLVLLESMACGTPMVSYRVGGVPELVREGETGVLAEPEDAAGLASRIAELLADKPRRRAMADRCRAVAEAEYSHELQVDRVLQLYKQVIEQQKSQC